MIKKLQEIIRQVKTEELTAETGIMQMDTIIRDFLITRCQARIDQLKASLEDQGIDVELLEEMLRKK